jgi:hypothetical protein
MPNPKYHVMPNPDFKVPNPNSKAKCKLKLNPTVYIELRKSKSLQRDPSLQQWMDICSYNGSVDGSG